MTKMTRQLMVGLMMAGLAGVGRPAAAQENEGSTISLRMGEPSALIPSDVLERSQAEVTRILRTAGVNGVWIHDASPNAAGPVFTVILRQSKAGAFSNISSFALGFAPYSKEKRGTIAYVLADRVVGVSGKYNVDLALLLGLTIAHEVGHLLLPEGHSDKGLMKADWNKQDFRQAADGRLSFTPPQVESIRTRLGIASAN